MKYVLLITLFFVQATYSVEKLKTHLGKVELGGLDSILKKKYIRVLTTRNPYEYYMYQGNTKGIQYEMIKEFTKHLRQNLSPQSVIQKFLFSISSKQIGH